MLFATYWASEFVPPHYLNIWLPRLCCAYLLMCTKPVLWIGIMFMPIWIRLSILISIRIRIQILSQVLRFWTVYWNFLEFSSFTFGWNLYWWTRSGSAKTMAIRPDPDPQHWKTVVRITILQDVIRSLLKKFKVADNPHKYALYEKCDDLRRDR